MKKIAFVNNICTIIHNTSLLSKNMNKILRQNHAVDIYTHSPYLIIITRAREELDPFCDKALKTFLLGIEKILQSHRAKTELQKGY